VNDKDIKEQLSQRDSDENDNNSSSKFLFIPKRQFHLLLLFIFISSVYLSLKGLGNAYFWDDEAHSAIIAKNLITTGRLTGWDGRNLEAFHNGTLLDKNLRPINPPLDYFVCALSFKIFGCSTWAGRFPFAIIGLMALAVFLLLLQHDFKEDSQKWIRVYTLWIFAWSPLFLLNIRQCRYYSLALLFSLLTLYFYRRCLKTKRFYFFIFLALAAILFFYSNFLICAAFLLSLGVTHLIFHRKEFDVKGWVYVALAIAIFLLGTLPYVIHYRIWHRADIPTALHPWYIRKLILVLWHFRELNSIGCLPWTIAVALVFFLIRHKKEVTTKTTLEWAVLGLGNVFFIAVFSPQPTDITFMANVRHLITAIPLLIGLVGVFLWFIRRWNKRAALTLFALIIVCNLPTITPFKWQFRWLLPAYVWEIHNPYFTSYQAVAQFLEQNAQQDDLVRAYPEYANRPLMFYVGHRVRFCCLLNQNTPLPREVLRKLNAPLFTDENFPQWFITFARRKETLDILEYFSREHVEDGETVQYEYRHDATLNVYWGQTQRPELPVHSFGPRINFDPQVEAVYIFKRINEQ
jgi:hypothetical protein